MADIIYPADLRVQNEDCCNMNINAINSSTADKCGCGPHYWMQPMPPEYPAPPFPMYPPYPAPPCPCPPPEPPLKKSSIEGKICRLSKKVATINRMIDNLEKKKKDVIIKVGDTSYNFGNILLEVEGWEEGEEGSSYAETVLKILKKERELIQEEIKALAEELTEDTADELGASLLKTVASEISDWI